MTTEQALEAGAELDQEDFREKQISKKKKKSTHMDTKLFEPS